MFSVNEMPSSSALRHLLVIQPIRRRILQALAIRERDAAPAADHVDEVRLLAGAARPARAPP